MSIYQEFKQRTVYSRPPYSSRIPTYEEIKTGTEKKTLITEIAELFRLGDSDNPIMMDPTGGIWNCISDGLVILCGRLDELGKCL